MFASSVLALLGAAEDAAARGKIGVLEQVTNLTEGTIEEVKMRSEKGTSIVFVSDGDVLGPGTAPDQKEIFYYNLDADTFVQITDTPPGGQSYQPARATDQTGKPARPEVVAFVSTGDFDDEMDNSDGNPEIFLYELGTGKYYQITDTMPPVVNENPYPSDNGKCIVFDSNADLHNNDGLDPSIPDSGFTNEDGSREVFIYEAGNFEIFPRGGQFTQASDGPAGTSSTRPMIGGYWFPRQCQSTVYMSDHDQTGESLPAGTHLFVYTRNGARLESMSEANQELPLGLLPGQYLRPHISSASNFARGPFAVFHTDADVWNNASTGFNIFRYRIFHPQLTQITDNEPGTESLNATVGDGGAMMTFQSSGNQIHRVRSKVEDQPPYNDDGNFEIFRLKTRRKMTQITRTEGCNNIEPSIRDDGTALAFISDCDLVPGQNPNGVRQIFRYFQVERGDPLLKEGGCLVEDGCCSPTTGCLNLLEGLKEKPSRRNCVERDRCEDRR